MTVVNPIWFWALSGLAIPVAIHLLSRKEGPVIRIGSIRFLAETATSKFSSIRLNELALLVLRSLLIVTLLLFLANLFWLKNTEHHTKQWLVIERGLEQESNVVSVLDSLKKSGYEQKQLATGFPSPGEQSDEGPDYYALCEALATEPVQAIVFARNSLANFKGKRIPLPANVTWVASTDDKLPEADTIPLTAGKPLTITVAYEPAFLRDKKIVIAALKSIQSVAPDNLSIIETTAQNFKPRNNTDWLIWLSSEVVSHPGKILRIDPAPAEQLIRPIRKNDWAFTSRLTEDQAIENHLPLELMNLLFGRQPETCLKELTLPNELVWSEKDAVDKPVESGLRAGVSLDKFLLLIIVGLLIAERVLAFYRKQ